MIDSFSAYKSAIKEKYQIEISGIHGSFLIKPTSASLRKLCILLMQGNKQSDKVIFRNFFGFEFNDHSIIQKLKNENDRFKPLWQFLRNESELSDNLAADLIAVLVDFQKRPYSVFLNSLKENEETEEKITVSQNPETNTINPGNETSEKKPADQTNSVLPLTPEPRWKFWLWKGGNRLTAGIGILLLASIMTTISYKAFYSGSCMQWQGNHYEEVACEQTVNPNDSKVTAMDTAQYKIRKITPTKNTVFFIDGKAVVWYHKQDNKYEFFDCPGYHPLTEKKLRAVTLQILTSAGLNPLDRK